MTGPPPSSPESQVRFVGRFGVALYFEPFAEAVAFYERALGPPAYVEGPNTRGWPVGEGWLTLLRGASGGPRNVEVILEVTEPGEAEALQDAFEAAGATATPPSDETMYVPVRSCPVRDPFGTDLLIVARLESARSIR